MSAYGGRATITEDDVSEVDVEGNERDLRVARLQPRSRDYDGVVRVRDEDSGAEWRFGVYGDEERRLVVGEQLSERDLPDYVERTVLRTGVEEVRQ